ncbi:anaerobic ribonucleotide reductase-activating protein [Pelotomaculum schinkii]|uniref:Anaerobic ribonucleotide reductase-activating protein n=1 Tax=Pelotomaculum schinkii TaxID=78350 RepID=A0A4Y7RG93_9FIRM|nr:4Fe-4S single cluster domain-containing protein [Pelotomaculum schinkii]TEB07770.1 anaerobic ribonucleotide reductase-activating protein [Pelotomaculum schinkii]
MNVARILYPVKVLGPGNRIGIWLCGCSRECAGCSNPELWHMRDEYEISVSQLLNLITEIANNRYVDGFTITGGEPMDQSQELAVFIKYIKKISDDILIYSGYTIDALYKKDAPDMGSILNSIAILIDGAYIEDRNNNTPLVGSDNQKINILNYRYKERYEKYLSTINNQIQNFTTTDGVISVGIHRSSFKKELDERIDWVNRDRE